MNKYRFLRFGALLLAGATLLPTTSCSFINSDNPITDLLEDLGGNDDIDEETGYSKMLMNVLNDEYYNSLIESAMSNPDLFESAEFDPHPYAFLEDEGYDISKIKDGTSECFTMSYVLDDEPNNLYIHTRLLVDDSYYVSYLLKYELTKQEMQDYQLMHGTPHGSQSYHSSSVFLNNEISEMKTPTIISLSKFTKDAYETIDKNYRKSNIEAPSKPCIILVFKPNKEENTLRMFFLPICREKYQMKYDSYILDANLQSLIYLKYENDIVVNSLGYTSSKYLSTKKHNAMVFNSQDKNLDFTIKLEDIET